MRSRHVGSLHGHPLRVMNCSYHKQQTWHWTHQFDHLNAIYLCKAIPAVAYAWLEIHKWKKLNEAEAEVCNSFKCLTPYVYLCLCCHLLCSRALTTAHTDNDFKRKLFAASYVTHDILHYAHIAMRCDVYTAEARTHTPPQTGLMLEDSL